jgi:sugar/nucleoside kinase (ribokinase family)
VRFVAVGDAFVDVVCDRIPQPGERRHGTVVLRAGGSAVNAALAAAALGAEASVVARVGSDPAGDLVVATLAASGVAANIARDRELPTGVAVAFGDAVVAGRGANARFSADDVPERLHAEALLVSGFALFQEGSREAAEAAFARFDGAWAAVDLASPKLAAGADLADVGANVVFATGEEASAVSGVEQVAIVCIKRAHGATARRGMETAEVDIPPVVDASPFGAGDAFAATFLVALAKHDDLRAALARACEAGARSAGAA